MRECNAPCWTAVTCVDSRLHGSGFRSPPLHCAPRGALRPAGLNQVSRIGEMKLNRWGGMARCSHGGAMRECNAPCWAAVTCVDSRLHASGVRSPPLHCALRGALRPVGLNQVESVK